MKNNLAFTFVYLLLISLIGTVLFLQPKFPETSPYVFMGMRLALTLALLFFTYTKKNLTVWIFFAMVLGVQVGLDFAGFATELDRLSGIFLRLIKTVIGPLIFATLVVGIAGHSDLKQVGRMGLKSILYFEIVTTLALFVGLAAINISRAGEGVNIQANEKITEKANSYMQQKATHDVFLDIFPENIAKSVAENQVLQIVVFSVLFGVGLSLVKGSKKETMLHFCESLSEVMFKFTHIVMYVAPFAVFGALAATVARSGLEILVSLFKLVGTLYAALIAFIVLVLVPIAWIMRINIRKFVQAISEPVSIAFATSTSEAALPKAMENMEKFGVPRKIVAFVLPTGYSFNLDGTTLYLSLASVFVAQMSGIQLTLTEQILMCLTLMLTSKGVAGVRGASFVILVTTVSSLGLDPSKAFIILAVDALMDMARTSVNVIGNCLATAVIAKSEGELAA